MKQDETTQNGMKQHESTRHDTWHLEDRGGLSTFFKEGKGVLQAVTCEDLEGKRLDFSRVQALAHQLV